MPTVVTKTVKYSGGDYSDIQSALNAITSDLVSADEQWNIVIGESSAGNYEWTVSDLIVPSRTTDATRYIRIIPESGKGFKDAYYADPTKVLRYNASNGIALKRTSYFTTTLSINANYTRVEGLQVKGKQHYSVFANGATNVSIRDCIIFREAGGDANYVVYNSGSSTSVDLVNCVIIQETSNDGCVASSGTGQATNFHNCTLVYATGSGTKNGMDGQFSSPLFKNTAIVLFSTAASSSYGLSSSSDYNATDASAPGNWGSHSLNGLTASAQLENLTSGSVDARAKGTGSLPNAGTRDNTYTNDLDIAGRARSTTTPTIGAWEFIPTSSDVTVTASDTNTPSDSAVAIVEIIAAAADTNTPSDSATSNVQALATGTDTNAPSDAANSNINATASASDTNTPTDSAASNSQLVASASDTNTPTDEASGVQGIPADGADTNPPSDSASATMHLLAAAADSNAPTDQADATVHVLAAANDSNFASDAGAAVSARIAAGVDTNSPTDSAAANAPTSRICAASDSNVPTDSATGTVDSVPYAAAFLDRYGRFAKQPADIYEVRVFTRAGSLLRTINRPDYLKLNRAQRQALAMMEPGAGYVDTANKSNA